MIACFQDIRPGSMCLLHCVSWMLPLSTRLHFCKSFDPRPEERRQAHDSQDCRVLRRVSYSPLGRRSILRAPRGKAESVFEL